MSILNRVIRNAFSSKHPHSSSSDVEENIIEEFNGKSLHQLNEIAKSIPTGKSVQLDGPGILRFNFTSKSGKTKRSARIFRDEKGNLRHNNLYEANEYFSPADEFIKRLDQEK